MLDGTEARYRMTASGPVRIGSSVDPSTTEAEHWATLCEEMMALADEGGGWLVIDSLDADLDDHSRAGLRDLLGMTPPACRVLLVTTRDLGAVLAEIRLAGRLVEIDQSDLTLAPDEAHQLLRAAAPHLEAGVADAVVDLCAGWAAALRVAADRARTHPEQDLLGWLRTRGAEQLLGGWWDQQPPPVQAMLARTAFLDVLHPSLVDAVLPGSGSGAALMELAHHPGPVQVAPQPSPEGHLGYPRHPLLTALLRRLSPAWSPEPELHVRAAAWYREHGDLTGELENLLAAGRTTEASERLLEHEERLLTEGEAGAARRWYEAVPVAQAPEDLTTLLRKGWASALSGDVVASRQLLGRLVTTMAEREGDGIPQSTAYQDLEGEVHALRAWLAHQSGDLHGTVAAARAAVGHFGDDTSRNSHQVARLYLARALTALDRTEEAERALAPLRDHAFALAVIGEGFRAEVEAELAWATGRVHESRSWAARHTRWSATASTQELAGHRPGVSRWLVTAEDGQAPAAATALEGVVRRLHVAPVHVLTDEVLASVGLAEALFRAARPREALTVLATAREVANGQSPGGGLLDRIGRCEARIRLCAGDVVRGERLLRALVATPDVLVLRIRLGLMRGSPVARQMIREVDPATPRLAVELALLSAWAHLERSPRRAEQDLLRAGDLAAASGQRTALLGAPAPLVASAERTAQHHVHDGLARLVAVAAPGPRDATEAAPPVVGTATSGFSRGELQLLALLRTRLTYAEVADHLVVSRNTLKTRLRRLFTKLGVHDRRGAVDRATELGLVDGPG